MGFAGFEVLGELVELGAYLAATGVPEGLFWRSFWVGIGEVLQRCGLDLLGAEIELLNDLVEVLGKGEILVLQVLLPELLLFRTR